MAARVLIGAPIHESKRYAMPRYLECLRVMDYPDFATLLIDNSPGYEFVTWVRQQAARCRFLCGVMHLDGLPDGDAGEETRLGASRETIRRALLRGPYDAWLSLECDVIASPNLLRELVPLLDSFDAVYHAYPGRKGNTWDQEGIGCALFSRAVLQDFPFDKGVGLTWGDVGLNRRVLVGGHFRAVRLYGAARVEHLDHD